MLSTFCTPRPLAGPRPPLSSQHYQRQRQALSRPARRPVQPLAFKGEQLESNGSGSKQGATPEQLHAVKVGTPGALEAAKGIDGVHESV